MKTIRSLITMVGLSMVVLVLGATGLWAQQAPSLSATSFAGNFTLPINARWGSMTLPAGKYTLRYGQPFAGGLFAVEVLGKEKGSPHGVILVTGSDHSSAAKSALVCMREGEMLIIRALEMPAVGKTVNFALSPGGKLVANNAKHSGYAQLAEAPLLIQRIPVTLK